MSMFTLKDTDTYINMVKRTLEKYRKKLTNKSTMKQAEELILGFWENKFPILCIEYPLELSIREGVLLMVEKL